jgi:alcohol dehydrogenase (cytochrome c)
VRSRFRQLTIVLRLLSAASAVHAAGDATAGKAAFGNQCAACHTAVIGKNGLAPRSPA